MGQHGKAAGAHCLGHERIDELQLARCRVREQVKLR